MLEFFEQLEQQSAVEAEEWARKTLEAERAYMTEKIACEHCGEVMSRALMPTNHNLVFNGWCSKRLFTNNRVIGRYTREMVLAKFGKNADQAWQLAQNDMKWLANHGWNVVDAWSNEVFHVLVSDSDVKLVVGQAQTT